MYAVDSRDEVVGGVVSKQSVESFVEQGWRGDDCISLSTNVARVGFQPGAMSLCGFSVICGGSRLAQGFFSGFSGFPPSMKTNISKFQLD